MGAELRLTARPLHEHDHVAGDIERDPSVMLNFDQRQGQIHPGGDTGRGEDISIPDKDRVALDVNIRIAGSQRFTVVPMCHGAPTVENSGLGQQEGAGTHADDALSPACGAGDPADGRAIGGGGRHAFAADADQGVKRGRRLIDADVGVQRDASGRFDSAGCRCNERDLVTWRATPGVQDGIGRTEYCGRTSGVDDLTILEDENANRAGRGLLSHIRSIDLLAIWHNDNEPSFSAKSIDYSNRAVRLAWAG